MEVITALLKPTIKVSDETVTLDGEQLLSQASHLSELLKRHHVKVMALYMDNSVAWIVADLACQLAEICCIPLPTFFSQQQLMRILKSNPIDAVVTDQKHVQSLVEIQHDWLARPVMDDMSLLLSPNQNPEQLFTSAYPRTTGKVTFTSCSTGDPKGVCLSHSQLLMQAQTLQQAVAMKEFRHLCLLPLSTLLENVAGVYAPLLSGRHIHWDASWRWWRFPYDVRFSPSQPCQRGSFLCPET